MTYLTCKFACLSLHLLTVTFFKCFLCTCSETQTCNGFCFYVKYHMASDFVTLHCTFCTILPFCIWISKYIHCFRICHLNEFFFLFHWQSVVEGTKWTAAYISSFFLLPFYPWNLGGLWIISEMTVDLRSLKELLFREQVQQNVAFPNLPLSDGLFFLP